MTESHLPSKSKSSGIKEKDKPVLSEDPVPNGDKMETEEIPPTQEALDLMCCDDIREHAKLIEKSMLSKEPRFLNRALRSLLSLRKKLNPEVLKLAINACCQSEYQGRKELLSFVDAAIESPVDPASSVASSQQARRELKFSAAVMTEIQIYLNLLVVIYMLDHSDFNRGLPAARSMIQKLQTTNVRATDPLSAKCYFYYARMFERKGILLEIRDDAHTYLRASILHHNHEATAVLINILLRIYLQQHMYEFAWNFLEKTVFPREVSNNELARHLYYLGRIKAVKLDYSAAQKDLLEASRKAPQKVAIGFRQQVHKLACVVDLLLGEIPERPIFKLPQYKKPLEPYLLLTRAVRTGNLEEFKEVSTKYKEKFLRDDTFMLIGRLRHNVIKAGIKRLNASYSCISLDEMASKLGLDSPTDALYTVAKAIKDKVIQAEIDYDQGCVQSLDNADVYSSLEPTLQYQNRIAFMLDIHRQCTLALRYPPKAFSGKDKDNEASRREREADLEELAEELADDEDDDEDMFP
jgi:26S proteasome regulatory subunit N3